MNAGDSTSTAPSLSTPAAPTPARIHGGDDGESYPQEEAAQVEKDSSIPESSAQGTVANAAGKAPAQGEDAPTKKDHPLDDF